MTIVQNRIATTFAIFIYGVAALQVERPSKSSRLPHHETHFSKEYLKDLAQREFRTILKLQNFSANWKDGQSTTLIKLVKRYLNDFAHGASFTEGDAITLPDYINETVRNPLAIFRTIHRVANSLYYMNREPEVIPGLPIYSLNRELGKNKLPLRRDLENAALGILSIHFMYDLNASDLAAGKVSGIYTRARMLSSQCLDIGVVAKQTEQFTLAVDWLREAKRLTEIDNTVEISKVQAQLIEVIHEHDEQWKEMESFKAPHFFFTKPLKSLFTLYEENQVRGRTVLERKYAGKGRSCQYWPMNTWGLCSGANLMTPLASSALFCWHEFKVHKIFSIGPLKMEFLSRNPDILKIHQAFMNEAVTANAMTEEIINKKVKEMTGLKSAQPTASDSTVFVNHVPGGHNKDVHIDSQEEHDLLTKGDRIATFMIYVNTAQEGGQTVFPTAFASTSKPTKGSVIFWFNTFSDGSPDFSSAHADCPVVFGEVLVAYKWIRFYDQFSTRKCLPQPQKRFQVLVNDKVLPVPAAFHHQIIEGQECSDAKPFCAATEPSDEDTTKRKYAHAPSSSLKATMQLEWEIYQNVEQVLGMRMETTAVPQTWISSDTLGENQLIRSYLSDFQEPLYNSMTQAASIDMKTAAKLAWNPLAVYRTFWRFEKYMKKLMMIADIQNAIGPVYDQNDGPRRTDLVAAMTGILLMQSVYYFESDDIADGFISGRDVGVILTARQCIEIGHQAIADGFHQEAIAWMQTAVAKVDSGADDTIDLEDAEEELLTAKKTHDTFTKKSDSMETTLTYDPNGYFNVSSRSIQKRAHTVFDSYRHHHKEAFVNNNWIEVCQGYSFQTVQERSKLFCWLETAIHPYFAVGPLKAEIRSMNPKPEVVLYHGILDQTLLAFLRNDTNRSFTASTASSTARTGLDIHLSATSSIPLKISQESDRIMKLTKTITGLNLVQRKINIRSYGPGGQFPVHADSAGLEGERARIATVVYYVTVPKMGGRTALSQAGIHVSAGPGSAILWYNALSSGEMDRDTYHGGCPVIFGEKRVAGQYLYYHDQHHLQCNLDPSSRIEILVNGKSKY